MSHIDLFTNWSCPNCGLTHQTAAGPDAITHRCPKLGGLNAPLIKQGVKAKVEAVKREDYVGTDIPQRDDSGNVVMAIKTTRDEGTDVIVLAPTATGRFE